MTDDRIRQVDAVLRAYDRTPVCLGRAHTVCHIGRIGRIYDATGRENTLLRAAISLVVALLGAALAQEDVAFVASGGCASFVAWWIARLVGAGRVVVRRAGFSRWARGPLVLSFGCYVAGHPASLAAFVDLDRLEELLAGELLRVGRQEDVDEARRRLVRGRLLA